MLDVQEPAAVQLERRASPYLLSNQKRQIKDSQGAQQRWGSVDTCQVNLPRHALCMLCPVSGPAVLSLPASCHPLIRAPLLFHQLPSPLEGQHCKRVSTIRQPGRAT